MSSLESQLNEAIYQRNGYRERAEKAEAERDRLRGAANGMLEEFDDYNAVEKPETSKAIESWNRSVRAWRKLNDALKGGEA